MTSHRIERANSFILQELTLALRNQARDPRVEPLTLTEVRLTADRRMARVFVACYSGDEALEEGLVALEAAKGFLRSHLAQHLHWRFTPISSFGPTTRGSRAHASRRCWSRSRRGMATARATKSTKSRMTPTTTWPSGVSEAKYGDDHGY